MLLGFGRVNISPENTVDLYSFDGQKRTSHHIIDELFVSSLVIVQEDAKVVIMSLDLIWLDRKLADELRSGLIRQGFKKELVLICATHSHSTPQIKEDCFNYGRPDEAYRNYLIKQCMQSVKQAEKNLAPGYIKVSHGSTNMTVNRRKKMIDIEQLKRGRFRYKIMNRPNFKKDCDNEFTALWVYDIENRPKGVVLNFACHPTLFRKNAVSADYPGKVASALQHTFGKEFVTCFLQGFSGNVKPAIVKKSLTFQYGLLKALYYAIYDTILFQKDVSEKGIQQFAADLAAHVLKQKKRGPVDVILKGQISEINLPLVPIPSKTQFAEMAKETDWVRSTYGKAMLEKKNHEFLPIGVQHVRLGHNIDIIAMEGEIFCEYAIWMRKELGRKGHYVLPVSCAGGMAGYIPDSLSIREGGYEVERSLMEFGIPSTFSETIESVIKSALSSFWQ